jgi:hypothetical protein
MRMEPLLHESFSCVEGGTSTSKCNGGSVFLIGGQQRNVRRWPSPAIWFSGSLDPPPSRMFYSWVSRNRTPQGAFWSDLNRVI